MNLSETTDKLPQAQYQDNREICVSIVLFPSLSTPYTLTCPRCTAGQCRPEILNCPFYETCLYSIWHGFSIAASSVLQLLSTVQEILRAPSPQECDIYACAKCFVNDEFLVTILKIFAYSTLSINVTGKA
jgi:hypothetical protein